MITGPWKQSLKRSPLSQGSPPAWPSSPTREPAGWALPLRNPLSWISQPPVASGEEPLSSPRLGPPERTIKTKEVMRPPQGGRESQAGEASGTLSYQEELLGASLVAQW